MTLQNVHPFRSIRDAAHLDRQRETIQKLRAQIAFFGVHRTHQNEAGRVGKADAFAFDHVNAHRSRVQQQVHHMVVQQVDLINVQDAPVSRSQHARLKMTLTLLDGFFDVQRTDHTIFCRAHWQVDKAHLAAVYGQLFAPLGPRAHFVRPGGRLLRVVIKRGVGNHIHFGQQNSQRAGRSGFAGAAFAANKHAADTHINRVENQRALHAFLADYRCEWVYRRSSCHDDIIPE